MNICRVPVWNPAIGVERNMRLCASYHCDPTNLDEIRYTAATLDLMVEKAIDVPDKLYILEIVDFKNCGISKDKLSSLVNELPNIIMDCYAMVDFLKLAVEFPKKVMYHYPCTTFNEIRYMLYVQPYAITLGEPLTFDLERVKEMLMGSEVKVRVLPAIGRPSTWNIYRSEDDGICHFWIAPHLVDLYSEYIDVLDLYDESPEREKALAKIYGNKEETGWTLSILLKNCEAPTGAYLIDEEFAENRMNCRQRCMQNKCHYCKRMESMINSVLYDHLSKNGSLENQENK